MKNGEQKQQPLDFKRGAKLRICERIELPARIVIVSNKSGKTQTVSGNACVHVLRAIESCCGKNRSAIVGVKDIAIRAKLSYSVVDRAITALSNNAAFVIVDGEHTAFHILAVTRRSSQRGRVANRYMPIWENANDFIPEK